MVVNLLGLKFYSVMIQYVNLYMIQFLMMQFFYVDNEKFCKLFLKYKLNFQLLNCIGSLKMSFKVLSLYFDGMLRFVIYKLKCVG